MEKVARSEYHITLPIVYPIIAPRIEQELHIKPKYNAFFLFPNARGINKISGGIGKKEASAIDIKPNILGPEGFSDQLKTQSYIFLKKCINYFL